MELISLPLWSQFGILGISIAVNLFILVEWVRGNIGTSKNVEQVQKIADSYQRAWEISEQTKEGSIDVLNKLLIGQDTMLRILEARPSSSNPDEIADPQ